MKQSSLDKRGLTVVSCPDLFAGNHLLTAHAKTCERMLRHRAVYGNNCRVVCILHTTWCSQRVVHPKESTEILGYLMRDEVATWVSELWQICKIHRSISSLNRKCSFMLKSDIKSCPSATDPFF